MNPFSFFDKIYLVNVSGETERLESSLIQLEVVGIKDMVDIRIVESHDLSGKTEDESLYLTTYYIFEEKYKLIKEAKENGYNNILILEDDIEFSPDIITKLPLLTNSLPDDWDLFYLTGKPMRVLNALVINGEVIRSNYDVFSGMPSDIEYIHKYSFYTKVSSGLIKATGSCFYLLQALTINSKMYDTFINKFESLNIEEGTNRSSIHDVDVDLWLATSQVNDGINAYLACPILARQKPFVSSRTREEVYENIESDPLYIQLLKK